MRCHKFLIAFGANIPSRVGAPEKTIEAARATLEDNSVRIRRMSSLYETPAWPDPNDPFFINAVAAGETSLNPGELLRRFHETETAYGRTRSAPNAPRTLDLDLLDFDGRIEEGPPALPHPRMERRAFVIVPLAEVAPAWRHPLTGRTAAALLSSLSAEERAAVRKRG
jgi:2-amino-4-hydroxy-6-hydroxymethyldihydropteridine diphosphokinase